MKNNGFCGMLGICAKAGAVASGAFSAEKAIKTGTARLVIVAADAAENTKADYERLCESRDIPFLMYADKETLGKAIGKGERTVIAITEKGLADSLRLKMT